METAELTIPRGFCQCGCGKKTKIARQTYSDRNWIKGEPVRYLPGHHVKHRPMKNINNPRWKGDNVGYLALHQWIKRCYGKPKKCEVCGTTDKNKRYEWANISGTYRRDINDFKRLCKECHETFDIELKPKGEKNGSSKLTLKDVLKIRKMYIPRIYTLKKLAKIFKITEQNVFYIIKRKTWVQA